MAVDFQIEGWQSASEVSDPHAAEDDGAETVNVAVGCEEDDTLVGVLAHGNRAAALHEVDDMIVMRDFDAFHGAGGAGGINY
jgi:hypothetical protein